MASLNFSGRFPCHAVATQIAVTTLKDCVGCDNRYDNAYSVGVPFTTGNEITNSITFTFTLKNYMTGTTLNSKTGWKISICATKYQSTATTRTFSSMVGATKLGTNSFTTAKLSGGGSTTLSKTISGLQLSPNTTYYVYIYDTTSTTGSYHSLCYLTSMSITNETTTPNDYTIYFNSNGGYGSMSNKKVSPGSSLKLPSCSFSPPDDYTYYIDVYRDGNGGNSLSLISRSVTCTYSFNGWSINGSIYKAGASYTPYGNTTIYANWKETSGQTPSIVLGSTTRSNSYNTGNLYFNLNGGECDTSQMALYGETTYEFLGWSTSRYATQPMYNSTTAYTFNGYTQLYAVWASHTAFNPVSLPTPKKDGYLFAGWSTSRNSTTANIGVGDYVPPLDNMELYAVWTEYKLSGVIPCIYHNGEWKLAYPHLFAGDSWHGAGNTTNPDPIVPEEPPLANSTYTVENIGSYYQFVLNSNDYYESQNKGMNSTTALCKLTVDMNGVDHLYIDCINYAETNYDYGILSDADTTISGASFSNTKKNFQGSSMSTIQTVDYGILTQGTHTIYIKFVKDGSQHQNNDSLQFKVRFE